MNIGIVDGNFAIVEGPMTQEAHEAQAAGVRRFCDVLRRHEQRVVDLRAMSPARAAQAILDDALRSATGSGVGPGPVVTGGCPCPCCSRPS